MNELSLTYVLVRHASGQDERSMAAVLRGFRFVSGSFCKHVAFGVGKSNKLAVYSDFARRCVLIKAEFVSRRLPVTRKLYFCSEFHSSSASSLNMNDMRFHIKIDLFSIVGCLNAVLLVNIRHNPVAIFLKAEVLKKVKLTAFIQISENIRNFLPSLCFLCQLF